MEALSLRPDKRNNDKNREPIIKRSSLSIGVDIEEIGDLPRARDFREDNFYKQNFSTKEISYCLLRPNIIQSFAGKFAVKEAIAKADNSYKNIPFNLIIVSNKAKKRLTQ